MILTVDASLLRTPAPTICSSKIAYQQTRYLKRIQTHYETLGIKQSATLQQVKSAFYEKSKKLHPDNSPNGGSTLEFVELKAAYDVLRRPADRRLYDIKLRGGGRIINDQSFYNYRNPYSGYAAPPQYDFTRDWSTGWSQKYDTKSAQEEREKSTKQFMRTTLKWVGIGVVIVVLYNGGYLLLLSWNQKKIDNLCDQDEIAKCFLRQSEFRNSNFEQSDISEIGRILKTDVDEAWKNRAQNPDEIREEYRWFRALQDADHIRSLKERRAQKKLEDRNRWRRTNNEG